MFKNRIRSQEGATILIALLFFLLCAVAGTIVLTAGTAASGRVSNLVTDEQSYYSATSAARMFKTEIQGKELQCTYNSGTKAYEVTVSNGKTNASFDKFLEDNSLVVFKVNQDASISLPSHDLDIKPTSSSGEENIKDVTANFKMDSDYGITVTINCGDFTCYVNAKASYNNGNKTVTTTQTNGSKDTTTVLTWSDIKISKQAQ